MDDYKKNGLEPTKELTAEYNTVVEKLLLLAPETVRVLDAEKKSYQVLTDAIREANKAKTEERVANITVAENNQKEAERRYRDADKELTRLNKEISDRKRAGETAQHPLAPGQRIADITGGMSALLAKQEQLSSSVKTLRSNYENATKSLTDLQDRAEAIDKPLEYQRKQFENGQAKIKEFANTLDTTGKGMETLAKRAKAAGFSMKEFLEAKNIDEAKAAIDDFQKKWTEHTAKVEQRKKQLENAIKGIWEGFRGTTVQLEALAATLPEILQIAQKEGPDAYIEALKKYDTQIQELAKHGKLTGASLDIVTKAANDLKEVPLDKALASWNKELEDMERNLQKAISDNARRAQDEARQDQIQQGRAMVELHEDINERIYDANVEMFERTHVARMNEVDQAIYAEQKRIADIERAVEKEIALRERALQYAREEVEERARMRRREHDDLIRSMLLQQQAKIENLKIPEGLEDARQRADRERQVAEAEKAAAQSRQRMAILTESAYMEIELDRSRSLAVIANREKEYAVLAQQQRGHVADQIGTSKMLVDRIIADNKTITMFLQSMLGTVVETFATAFRNILTGTMSWKDAMIGVFKSLQNALFNVFDSILKKWIENAATMAKAEGGFSASKFFGGLFGAGSAFGKGAPVPVMTPGGPVNLPGKPGIFQSSPLAAGAVTAAAGGLVGYGLGGMFDSTNERGAGGCGRWCGYRRGHGCDARADYRCHGRGHWRHRRGDWRHDLRRQGRPDGREGPRRVHQSAGRYRAASRRRQTWLGCPSTR